MRSELTNYGCIGKGFSSLKTEFEKNIYCPNEVAKAIVTVDNSGATIDTDTVTFAVAQHFKITIEGREYKDERVLAG